jgi:hypothetical protein
LSVVLLCMITLQVPAPDRGDAASATSEFARRDEVFSAADGAPPLELHFLFLPTSNQQERLIATTKEALSRMTSWFGPLGTSPLTLIDGAWRAASPDAAASVRDRGGAVVVVRTRWLSPERDISLERVVFTAIARAFWATLQEDPESPSFADGLARYSAARAINEAFEGRSPQTYRYFGGFVPHTIRAISLSRSPRDPRPPIFRLPEFEPSLAATAPAWTPVPSSADRAAAALVTLERVVGWPAMQAALLELRHRSSGRQATARELATVMSEQRGSDVTAFVEAVSSGEGDVDYVVDELTTTRDGGRYQTTVKVRRQGSPAFPVPVLTRFADGSETIEWWPGEDASREFSFTAPSPAAAATVDPEVLVVLDADRANNTRTLVETFRMAGARLTVSWAIWLQNLVLTYASLV